MADHKPTMDEIVFENRNKEYGAYYLRSIYPVHLKKSLGIITLICFFAGAGSFGYLKYKPKEVVVKEKSVEVDLATIEIPPLDPTLPPPPPPPPTEPPKVKTVKYVPPKVVPDDQVKQVNQTPVVDSLENAVVSNVTQDGEIDSLGVSQAESHTNGVPGGTGEEDNTLYTYGTGIHATFPGGEGKFNEFIQSGMKRSIEKAQRLKDKGIVYVYFIVEKDGSITNVDIKQGLAVCKSCNEEAKSLMQNMPKWEPAQHNGRPVRVQYMIPIQFAIEE